ncbi:YheC/YheD family protein [Bacillus sp. S/N-304-OC-R1]|uniref:YheC/YheD family endospore coat-associated protein n=1 Tax=Bacillus sp. S/N-304-OC-R1 TaxID=2758034 RepID=UPI001C8EFCDC|nr:YheC/YheD family protein [Bacillus sp. S/N-304-OC-R1]MBY0123099.1 YheC/YheD family protein [Bacillus sp. S/N-304-OC-R1]
MRQHYQVEILHDLSQKVYIPAAANLETPLSKVAFGSQSIEASIEIHEKPLISLSHDVADKLKFPDLKVPLHIFSDQESLYIGPLVGIFTSGFTPFQMRPIGERSLFFAKLLSVKKSVGAIPFVFGEQHINWDLGTINGLFYDGGWKNFEIPFPNVVYDRLPNRKSERKAEQKNIKERLQSEYLIPWYNPGFFNKLDIYDRLIQDDRIAKFLPETLPFLSFSEIERMLSEYGHVYMKPIHGSLGLGIHQILYEKSDSYYYCRYRNHQGENKLLKFNTLEGLMKQVFAGKRLNRMLVQQGIHLLRIDQRPIDFRIHTNKNNHGEWVVTAIAAKVAGAGSVTTHVRSGGVIKTIAEVFPSEEEEKQVTEKLSNAALLLSKALEENMEGIIGEIGFDLGIDRKGNVWLFEANSKPGRSIFKHPQMKEFDFLTRKLSLSFAVFLAERAIIKPEEVFG